MPPWNNAKKTALGRCIHQRENNVISAEHSVGSDVSAL
jgi:hypothetical protein